MIKMVFFYKFRMIAYLYSLPDHYIIIHVLPFCTSESAVCTNYNIRPMRLSSISFFPLSRLWNDGRLIIIWIEIPMNVSIISKTALLPSRFSLEHSKMWFELMFRNDYHSPMQIHTNEQYLWKFRKTTAKKRAHTR